MEELKDLFLQRKKKFEELIQEGFPPYPNTFRISHSAEEIARLYGDRNEEEFKTLTERFSVAGRLVRLNHFGKAAFGHIQDRTGRIQGYFRRDQMSPGSFQVFSRLDIGVNSIWCRQMPVSSPSRNFPSMRLPARMPFMN